MVMDKDLTVIHCYKTDRFHLPKSVGYACSGLAYRRSLDHDDLDEHCVASWDAYVWGTPREGGFVKVGKLFLPMVLHGVPVLRPVEHPDDDLERFSIECKGADTSFMSSPGVTPLGLQYTRPYSKGDTHFMVPWDSVVFGKLDTDTIEVNGRTLPLKVGGQDVVIKQEQPQEVIKQAEDTFPALKADKELKVLSCFKIDRVHLPTEIGHGCAGLAYRRTPNQWDKDEDCVACWDTYVWGTPHAGGFVKVGNSYLPTTLHGVPVLASVEHPDPDAQRFSIEGGNLDTTVSCLSSYFRRPGATSKGLLYRKTPNTKDVDGNLSVPWNSVVFGTLEEDFVQVNGRYLPLKVDGCDVVMEQDKLQEVIKAEVGTESLDSAKAAIFATPVSEPPDASIDKTRVSEPPVASIDDKPPSIENTRVSEPPVASTDRELAGGQVSQDAKDQSSDIQLLTKHLDAVGKDVKELLDTLKSVQNRVKALESSKASSSPGEAKGNLEFRLEKSNRDFEERLAAIAESHLEQVQSLEARLASVESGKVAAAPAPAPDVGLKDLEARLAIAEDKLASAAPQAGSTDVPSEEQKRLVSRIAACEAELRQKASGAVVEALHRTGGEVTTLKETLTKRIQACEAALNNRAYGESVDTSGTKENVAMALSQEAKQELSQVQKALADEESARMSQLSSLQDALTTERNERTKKFQFFDVEIGKRASSASLNKLSQDLQRLEQQMVSSTDLTKLTQDVQRLREWQMTGPSLPSPAPVEAQRFDFKQASPKVAAYEVPQSPRNVSQSPSNVPVSPRNVPMSPRTGSLNVPLSHSPSGPTISSSPTGKQVPEVSSDKPPTPPSQSAQDPTMVYRTPSSPQLVSPRILIGSPSQPQMYRSPPGSAAYVKTAPAAPKASSRGTSPVVIIQGGAGTSRSVSPQVLQAQPQVLPQRVPGMYIIPGAQGS